MRLEFCMALIKISNGDLEMPILSFQQRLAEESIQTLNRSSYR
jgi:hypothetical protein